MLQDDYERLTTSLLDQAGGKDQLEIIVRQLMVGTIDWLLDPGECLNDVEGAMKTAFGTKMEKRFTRQLGLPEKRSKTKKGEPKTLDTVIASILVDIKCTLGGKTWMIPREAVNHYCLLFKADYHTSTFDVGIIFASPENLTKGKNQDKKLSVRAKAGREAHWIIKGAHLPYTGDQARV